MQIKQKLMPLAIVAGFAWAGQALAQSEVIDVTLEVLDDVSDIDAVVVRLEDARDRDEDRDRAVDEARARDEFDQSVRDAEAEREVIDREIRTERTERRELENEESDIGRDFEERDRERQEALEPAVDEPVERSGADVL